MSATLAGSSTGSSRRDAGRHLPADASLNRNIEAEAAIAGRYGIRGIPSMVMIRKGQEIARTSGAMPTSAIVNRVEQAPRRA